MSGGGSENRSDATVLSLTDVYGSIAGQQVIEGVSFDVAARGVTALMGRNGVGKTSTIKAILGLIERRGQIVLDGRPIDRLSTHQVVRLGVGYVPEDREVFSRLTVRENLTIAERDASPRYDLVYELFPELSERGGQMAGTLSGGQQQMLALGRALLNENVVLLIDEPTKGLAPRLVADVGRALVAAAEHAPILLVEQNLQVIRDVARDAVVLAGGRVVHTGSAVGFLDDEDLVQRLLGVHAEPEVAS